MPDVSPRSATFHPEGRGIGPPPSYRLNTFDNTPIYGFASLTVYDDGSWALSGHVHNDGWFNVHWFLTAVFVAGSGKVYTINRRNGVDPHADSGFDTGRLADPRISETWDSIVAGHFYPALSGHLIVIGEGDLPNVAQAALAAATVLLSA
jgi:hypothetical protein